jgi:hypothetical protein
VTTTCVSLVSKLKLASARLPLARYQLVRECPRHRLGVQATTAAVEAGLADSSTGQHDTIMTLHRHCFMTTVIGLVFAAKKMKLIMPESWQ